MTDGELKLIDPAPHLREAFLAMLDEFRDAGEEFHQAEREKAEADFDAFVNGLHDEARGIGLPEGYVPYNTYWLVCDGRIVATGRLRHSLDGQAHDNGHIGYDVVPSRRREGIATRLLGMMLEKARRLGLKSVTLVCRSDNTASIRVIEKNGGVFECDGVSTRSGQPIKKYRIEL